MTYKIYNNSCLESLDLLDDETLDLTLTSPPYCIGKAYDVHTTVEGFVSINEPVIKKVWEKTKPGGSVCWQVGHHVTNAELIPLDFIVHDIFSRVCPDAKLRNRIVWTFGHGANCLHRFSGRHEIVMWYTKGAEYSFYLDNVRIKQRYPGKKHYRGDRKGEYSCNPLGKNPGDVWDIPNVKAKHVEKTEHPCQFPIALAQRLVCGLTAQNDLVLDPFMGAGTTGAAAVLEGRRFVGMEIDSNYFSIAKRRIREAELGTLKYRPIEKPILDPASTGAVGRSPFLGQREGEK